MTQCQNCGQVNAATSNFCRFCGTKFPPAQSSGGNYEYDAPRPYAWKTDELQIAESKARKSKQINQVQPLDAFVNNQPPRPQPLAYRQPQNMAYSQLCPRCANTQVPIYKKKVSTAGWIVFAILMVVFFRSSGSGY